MLEITGLSKTYANGVCALDGVDLSIAPGMFGLLGPNGAGKSSLMRTIATLQRPDAGSIKFDGIDVLAHPRELRARLGYLPQDFGVYPRISAVALLHHLAVLKGLLDDAERREQVDALLHRTNLYKVRRNSVGTFSGGMLQRFGIAQALLGDPALLIVDEPTAGLDPEERNRFLDLLGDIGESVVVLLSTHIVADVTELCPSTAILAEGRILSRGRPAELIEELAGRVWHRTIGRDLLPEYRARHTVISTRLSAGRTQLHVLADACPEAGFEPSPPSLEDVYFTTLRHGRSAGAPAAGRT